MSDVRRSEIVQMLTVDGILDGTGSSPKEPTVYVNQAAAYRDSETVEFYGYVCDLRPTCPAGIE